MKLARTIRFDPSDLNIFPTAAERESGRLLELFVLRQCRRLTSLAK